MNIMGRDAPKLDLDNDIAAQTERFLEENEKLKNASHKLNVDFLRFNNNFKYSAEDNSFIDVSKGPIDADNLTNPSKKARTIVTAEKQGDIEEEGEEFNSIPPSVIASPVFKSVSSAPSVISSPASKSMSSKTPLLSVLVNSSSTTPSPQGSSSVSSEIPTNLESSSES